MKEQKFLYAKSNNKTVMSHLIDTAAVCFTLLCDSTFQTITTFISSNTGIDRENVIQSVSYIAGLHDIGKIHPIFQKKILNNIHDEHLWTDESYLYTPLSEKQFRHEQYSENVLIRIWTEQDRFLPDAIDCYSNIISLHHQGKTGDTVEIHKKDRNIWWGFQSYVEESITQVTNPQQLNEIIEYADNKSAVCMMILGLVILSDWIASSKAFLHDNIEHYDSAGYKKYYCQQIQKSKRLISHSRIAPVRLETGITFSDVWKNIPSTSIRPLQACMESVLKTEQLPSLTIVEAPMGEGKTECGIYAAVQIGNRTGKNGMYIALPTAATSNQMYERTKDFLLSHNIEELRLLHSMSWMLDEETAESVNLTDIGYDKDQQAVLEWTKPVKRGLLEPFSVGTIDQVLMAALRVKYGVLRLVGIQGKVLLLDEVHAYDAYMQDIIIRLLEWCRVLNIPVIMLSATLATYTKAKMLQVYGTEYHKEQVYPAITTVYPDHSYKTTLIPDTCNKRCIKIKTAPFLNNESKIAEMALEYVQDGGCICILMNTVKKAQTVYKYISTQASSDIQLFLFHARFSVRRRTEIEKTIINLFGKDKTKRPVKAILVCTQVVEQSLDVDFDTMITDIAPIDLILQRSGRVFRHDETNRPEAWKRMQMTVLIPNNTGEYGVSAYIYPEILLSLTIRYLQKNSELRYPESIRQAVEYVYGNSSIKEEELEKWAEKMFKDQIEANQASVYELPEPDPDDFYIYNSDNVFDDNENVSFLSAKTRLSNPSIRIAIVREDLFHKIITTSYISTQLAKQVMLESVNISMKDFSNIKDVVPEDSILEGKGLLSFITILKGKDGTVLLEDGRMIHMNEQIGFEIIKGGCD